MKQSIRLIGLAALLALPAVVSAQTTRPVTLGVSGGLSAPMGNLGDGVDAGYVVAGHVWFQPASMPSIMFRGDVSYDNWKSKIGNFNLRSLGATANAIIHPSNHSNSVIPYLIAGGGIYNTKSYTTSTNSSTNSDLGIQGGAGIEFKLAGFSTFAEAKFVNVFTGDNSTNWIPVTFGIRF